MICGENPHEGHEPYGEIDITPEELEILWRAERLTQQEIAEMYDCGRSTIQRRLKKWDIEREEKPERGYGGRDDITCVELEHLYYDRDWTVAMIADYFNTSTATIHDKMKAWGLEPKDPPSGEDHYYYGVTGEDHPCHVSNLSEEERQRRSDLIIRLHEEGRIEYTGPPSGDDHVWRNRDFSDETIRKLRNIALDHIEERSGQAVPFYNPDACEIIDEYGKRNGYNFRHAENHEDGEFRVPNQGYIVDGYDDERNTVIEYYEEDHKKQRDYDERRKSEIMEELGCTFIELYWDGRERITKVEPREIILKYSEQIAN